MTASVVLIICIPFAYLSAHVMFEWMVRRFTIVSGAEYLLFGVLLGPYGLTVLSPPVISDSLPMLALAIGWIGTISGTRIVFRTLVKAPARDVRIAFVESGLTFLSVAALAFAALWCSTAMSDRALLPVAVTLAAIGVASSNVGIDIVMRRDRARHRVLEQLRLSTVVNALVAVTAFGVMLCVYHARVPRMSPLTATQWLAVCVASGVVGGILFNGFLGENRSSERLFVVLFGGIGLITGASAQLQVSSLFVAMCLGMALVNTTVRHHSSWIAALTRAERPLHFLLFLYSGALWQPSPTSWIAPLSLVLAARVAGKVGGSRLAARMNGALDDLGVHWGRGLLGQGGLGMAIGLSYFLQSRAPFRQLVLTTAAASVLVFEFGSARRVRWLITDHAGAKAADDRARLAPPRTHVSSAFAAAKRD